MSTSLHPGTINTDLSRYAGSLLQRFGRLVTFDVSYGAITSLYAGTAPDASSLNGKVGTAFCLGISPHVLACVCGLSSILLRGHVSWFRTRRRSTPSPLRSCGNGVKSKSKISRLLSSCKFHALGPPVQLNLRYGVC